MADRAQGAVSADSPPPQGAPHARRPARARRLVSAVFRGYKYLISPLLPPACRFVPTCSQYAVEAVETHGVLRGLLMAAWRILRPQGQVMILDLLKHKFVRARDLYGDRWPGFAESDLHRWLEVARFRNVEISVVAREDEPPHFTTVLAAADK